MWLSLELEYVLARQMKKKGNQARAELLIQWKGFTVDDSTGVDLEELQWKFPDFEGKVF